MDDFARRLKEVRQNRGYSQEELAKITKISVKTIQNYEQGVCEPISVNLLDIATVLDVTPEYLLKGEVHMNVYTTAIKNEMLQLKDYNSIMEIKGMDLNATILSHLEMTDELVGTIKDCWNAAGIFKRTTDECIEVDSFCTRNFVHEVLIRYCQNRMMFKQKFCINDGMLSTI